MIARIIILNLLAAWLVLCCNHSTAQEVVYPEVMFTEHRIIDVTRDPYNADPTGRTDATAALQKAISDNLGRQTGSLDPMPMILYFPNGTYQISDTLAWKLPSGRWGATLVIQGQSRDGVIIKLADRTPAFGDPVNPKPLIITADRDGRDGTGNAAFENHLANFTIDAGVGNPGALGVDFLGSNSASVRDLLIRSSDPDGAGAIGLGMLRKHAGPQLVKDIEIQGFDIGFKVIDTPYNVIIEGLKLTGQRDVGIETGKNVLALRHVESDLDVPVLRSEMTETLLVILDSTFKGGASGKAAMTNAGQTFLQRVSAEGSNYASLIDGAASVPGLAVENEWVSGKVLTLFDSDPQKSLGLEVRETPEINWNGNFDDWAIVTDFGANVDDIADDTEGIEKAMNSGKPVVFFPPARREGGKDYRVSRTIEVPGTVKHIIGNHMVIRGMFESDKPMGNPPIMRFVNPEGSRVLLDGMTLRNGTNTHFTPLTIEIAGAGEVVLTNVNGSIANAPGAGPLFLENVVPGSVILRHPQKVWARQLNPESEHFTKIVNAGADLWVLGFKTERSSSSVATSDGGRTEIHGALMMSNEIIPPQVSATSVENAAMSISFATVSTGGPRQFQDIVRATAGDDTRVFHKGDGYDRDPSGYKINNLVPLAVIDTSASYPSESPTPPTDAPRPTLPSPEALPQAENLVQWLDASHPMARRSGDRVLRWFDASGKQNDSMSDELAVNGIWSADAVDGLPGISMADEAWMLQTSALSMKKVDAWTTLIRFKTSDDFNGIQYLLDDTDGQRGMMVYLHEKRLVIAVGHQGPDLKNKWIMTHLVSDPLKPQMVYELAVRCRFGDNFDGELSASLNGVSIGKASGLQRIQIMAEGNMGIGLTVGPPLIVQDDPAIKPIQDRSNFSGWINTVIKWDAYLDRMPDTW